MMMCILGVTCSSDRAFHPDRYGLLIDDDIINQAPVLEHITLVLYALRFPIFSNDREY